MKIVESLDIANVGIGHFCVYVNFVFRMNKTTKIYFATFSNQYINHISYFANTITFRLFYAQGV